MQCVIVRMDNFNNYEYMRYEVIMAVKCRCRSSGCNPCGLT
jgi:hypothetical protein